MRKHFDFLNLQELISLNVYCYNIHYNIFENFVLTTKSYQHERKKIQPKQKKTEFIIDFVPTNVG